MRFLLLLAVPLVVAAAQTSFDTDVKPVLARTCTPCHQPGGQMYEKLPFDKADVVRGNKEGILRRLKGEDNKTVEKWLAEATFEPARDSGSTPGSARP